VPGAAVARVALEQQVGALRGLQAAAEAQLVEAEAQLVEAGGRCVALEADVRRGAQETEQLRKQSYDLVYELAQREKQGSITLDATRVRVSRNEPIARGFA
jgi:hypothetical protein